MSWLQSPSERSIACDPQALRFHRGRRRLTQPELASLARLSTRLVAKAEAGEKVRTDSVEILAAALSTSDHPVFPEDLVFSPRKIARYIVECYTKHERQCVAHCHQYLSDDMTVVAPGNPEVIPFAGERKTIDGFDEFWGRLFRIFDRPEKNLILDTMRVLADGNEVVVLSSETATVCGESGGPPVPLAFVMEFERGKLKKFEDHFDVRQTMSRIHDLAYRNSEVRTLLREFAPEA